MAESEKDIQRRLDLLDQERDVANKISKGLTSVIKANKTILEVKYQIYELDQQITKINKEIESATGEQKKELEGVLEALEKEKKELKDGNKILKSQAANFKNISMAISRDMYRGLQRVGKELKSQMFYYFEQNKAVRRTATDVGLLGKRYENFNKVLTRNAYNVTKLGSSVAEVAETYGSYAEEVGRTIPLSDRAAVSFAQMAKGTALGAEGSAQMAANMEIFGLSIERSADYVLEVSSMSEKMGVNSGKVLKQINSNFKRAQTFAFKGGVRGIAKMAALSERLRMDMSEVLGFAEKLFDPEGAVEAAASLQVMGGAFSQMADPFKLMYMARNDVEGLTTQLANAAAESARFNSETGEFEITGMELHRLRQIAETTGISIETLTESARTAAKEMKIKGQLNFDKESEEFIASMAKWDPDKGAFVVEVDGEKKTMAELRKMDQSAIKNMMSAEKGLEARAQEAQSFDERIKNLINGLKTLLMPFFDGVESVLRPMFEDMMGEGGLLSEDSSKMIRQAGVDFGNFIKSFVKDIIPVFKKDVLPALRAIGKFITDNPTISAIIGLTALLGGPIMKVLGPLTRIIGGLGGILGGFVSKLLGGIKGLGAFGRLFAQKGTIANPMIVENIGGEMGGGFDGSVRRKNNKLGRNPLRSAKAGWRKTRMGRKGFMGRAGGAMRGFGKGMGGMLRGAGRFLGGAGLSTAGMLIDPDLWGVDRSSALGKGMGIGSSTLEYAGYGAMLGSIIPGVGNLIGGIAGGLLGLGKGLVDNLSPSKGLNVASDVAIVGDGVVSPDGNVLSTKQGAIQFDKDDYIMATKNVSNGSNGSPAASEIKLSELKVSGTINLVGGGTSASMSDMLRDPIFIRKLKELIMDSMEESRAGAL